MAQIYSGFLSDIQGIVEVNPQQGVHFLMQVRIF